MSDASVGRIVRACIALAAIHSLLASRQAKNLARQIAGSRYRNGLYRVAYNAQSVVFLVWAVLWFSRLPDRELYEAKPPWSWFFRVGQAASLGVLLSGVRVIGLLDFAGVTQLQGFLSGQDPEPEPEAQGPPIGADGEMVEAEAFHFTRHPGNLGVLGFFLFFPRMTVNRAVLAALVTLYGVLGSLHEEYRLQVSYGAPFERYRRKVPFMVPRPPK